MSLVKHGVTKGTPSRIPFGAGAWFKNLAYVKDTGWGGTVLGATSGGSSIKNHTPKCLMLKLMVQWHLSKVLHLWLAVRVKQKWILLKSHLKSLPKPLGNSSEDRHYVVVLTVDKRNHRGDMLKNSVSRQSNYCYFSILWNQVAWSEKAGVKAIHLTLTWQFRHLLPEAVWLGGWIEENQKIFLDGVIQARKMTITTIPWNKRWLCWS